MHVAQRVPAHRNVLRGGVPAGVCLGLSTMPELQNAQGSQYLGGRGRRSL